MTTQTENTTQEPSDADVQALFSEISDQHDAARAPAVVDEVLTESLEGTGEEPAASTTAAPTPAAPATNAAPTPAQAAQATDMPDGLTPEQQDKWNRMFNERNAAIGRASAAQRELARRATAPAPAPTPAALPEAEQLSNAFPDLSQAVSHEIDKRTQAITQGMQQEITKSNLATLDAIHPKWHETMKGDQFQYWLSQEPPESQAKFQSNSVADYSDLLTRYRIASSPTQVTPAPKPQTEAERLAAERAERTRQQSGLPRGASTVGNNVASEPGDPDALFNQVAARLDLTRMRAAR